MLFLTNEIVPFAPNPLHTMRPSLRPFAPLLLAAILLAGFGGDLRGTDGALRVEGVVEDARSGPTPNDTVMVFVVWGNSNACGAGRHPGIPPHGNTPPAGTAWEWHHSGSYEPQYAADPFPCWKEDHTGLLYHYPNTELSCDPTDLIPDPIPPCDVAWKRASAWPTFAGTYNDLTGGVADGHVLFISSFAKGSTHLVDGITGEHGEWYPDDTTNLYDGGLDLIADAMAAAQDELGGEYDVVFGGVLWHGGPGGIHAAFPYEDYEDALGVLLDRVKEDVVDVHGGRFYLVNTLIPKVATYDHSQEYALDLESDVCREYAHCSMVHGSVEIKADYDECEDQACRDEWYDETLHWNWRGLEQIGETTAHVAVAEGLGEAPTWELGVEVPVPAEWCASSPPCETLPPSFPTFRLHLYDDAGDPLDGWESGFPITPSVRNPDWRADLDGDDLAADLAVPSWSALGTAFLTLELVREDQPSTPLARYVYVPGDAAYGAGQTDFYRPSAEAGSDAVLLEVFTDGAVAARHGTGGPTFEGVFASDGPYVMPYDHGAFAAACAAVSCTEEHPDFFLARLPEGAPLPTAATQRYTFTDADDVVIPATWGTGGALAWEVPGLELAFPAGRRLVVEGALEAEGVTLTEAVATEGWGGVVFRQPSVGEVTTGSALSGVVVEKVRGWDEVLYHGAVEVHNRALVIDGESEVRDSAGAVTGVVGLLATGGAEVTVTEFSQIYENDGGGVHATGGAEVTVSDGSEVFLNPGVGVLASGFETEVTLDGAVVRVNGGAGVVATNQGVIRFASASTDDPTTVEDNLGGGLDAQGALLDAGRCNDEPAPCAGRAEHFLLRNSFGGEFDVRSVSGAVAFAQGDIWHTTDVSQLVLEVDSSSVLAVCPMVGDGGTCADPAPRLVGGGRLAEGGGEPPGGEPPLRLHDVLALVDAAERAHLAGDVAAFEIAAAAAVAALDTSQAEDARRAAFEVTSRLFAWAQPAAPLDSLAALAQAGGEGQAWARRALGVARASTEDYVAARALSDTLVTAYAGSEHAAFGHALAVRVAVAERDEAAAVAALTALASAFAEADEIGSLAALVAGAFPDVDLTGVGLRVFGGASGGGSAAAPAASASATAPRALLEVGEVRPNPSSAGATLSLTLNDEAHVEAVLYDALGRRVAVLASREFVAGRHALVLDAATAARLASGVYVVHVTAGATDRPVTVAVRRLTLTR